MRSLSKLTPAALSLGIHGVVLGLILYTPFLSEEVEPIPIQVVWEAAPFLSISKELDSPNRPSPSVEVTQRGPSHLSSPPSSMSSPPSSMSSPPSSMSSPRKRGSTNKATKNWIPAYAGMTKGGKSPPRKRGSKTRMDSGLRRNDKEESRNDKGMAMKKYNSFASQTSSSAKATPPRIFKPLPEYPWIARKRNQEGVVCLNVVTDGKGCIKCLSLTKSSGHTQLDKAAMEAVKNWVFAEANHQESLSIAFKLNS